MQSKGAGPVNRVELESQVICAALRQSFHLKDRIGGFTSVRELSHLFPDLLPPPEKHDELSQSNKANYYAVLGVRPQSSANSVIAAYLRTVRAFLRTQKATEARIEYNKILNAGFVLRKPRLRLSHDLVVTRRWLHEESRLSAIAQSEQTMDSQEAMPFLREELEAMHPVKSAPPAAAPPPVAVPPMAPMPSLSAPPSAVPPMPAPNPVPVPSMVHSEPAPVAAAAAEVQAPAPPMAAIDFDAAEPAPIAAAVQAPVAPPSPSVPTAAETSAPYSVPPAPPMQISPGNPHWRDDAITEQVPAFIPDYPIDFGTQAPTAPAEPQQAYRHPSEDTGPGFAPASDAASTPVESAPFAQSAQSSAAAYSHPSSSPDLSFAASHAESAQSFEQPPASFEQPPSSFEQPPASFEQPPASFEQPPASFEQSPASFEQPPSSFEQPPSSFEQPPASFEQPPAAFEQPPASFEQPPASFEQPPAAFEQPSASFEQPPAAFEQPAPATFDLGGSPEQVDFAKEFANEQAAQASIPEVASPTFEVNPTPVVHFEPSVEITAAAAPSYVDPTVPVEPEFQPASVRAQDLPPEEPAAERGSGRISKEATFVFDESSLAPPASAQEKKIPMLIQLLEAAQFITPVEVQALVAQMAFAPNVPVEKLILNAGYITASEMASVKLGESLLNSGKINMAQFQVAIYDERTSGLRMAESLQVRGWLNTEVRNAIDEFQKKRS